MKDPELTAEQLQFVEDVAAFFELEHMPRMCGRVVAWLLICDPPEQSALELCAVLGASRGSVSTVTRMLVEVELIKRVARPGDRREYFRITEEGWGELSARRIRKLSTLIRALERGARLLDGQPVHLRQRLESMTDFYRWLEAEMPAFFETYKPRNHDNSRGIDS